MAVTIDKTLYVGKCYMHKTSGAVGIIDDVFLPNTWRMPSGGLVASHVVRFADGNAFTLASPDAFDDTFLFIDDRSLAFYNQCLSAFNLCFSSLVRVASAMKIDFPTTMLLMSSAFKTSYRGLSVSNNLSGSGSLTSTPKEP